MTPARQHPINTTSSLWAAFALCFILSPAAHAAGPASSSVPKSPEAKPLSIIDEYEIKSGDNIGAIAIAYGIEEQEIIEANGIENADRIFAGQLLKIPGDPKNGKLTTRGVVLNIPKGFNLTLIAKAYEMPVSRIIQANKLANPDRVAENQELLIPGVKKIVKLIPPPPCFKDPTVLYRVRNQKSHTIPLCYCSGRPNPKALEVLSELAGPVNKPAPFPLHPRILELLQKVAERFPGQRLEIVSGQRVARQPGHESYHNKGQALDFRVAGVANRELAQFIRTLDNTGVGYYPNSVFVHMDTRDRKAYWIDYSRPGEKAIYGRKGMSKTEIAAIRKQRKKPLRDRITDRTQANIHRLLESVGETGLPTGATDPAAEAKTMVARK